MLRYDHVKFLHLAIETAVLWLKYSQHSVQSEILKLNPGYLKLENAAQVHM